MKTLFTLPILVLSVVYVNAQAPAIEWQKCLGGSGYEYANSIIQTQDGGYIVAGYSDSNNGDLTENKGLYDYWIVKLDALGSIIWQKSLGGSVSDIARSITQTQDGGYIVAGYSTSNNGDVSGNHGDHDYWIIKLDALGNNIWQKSLGGNGNDRAFSITQTQDGGYIVAGISASNNGDVSGNHGNLDYWIVKLDALGAITWQRSLGGSGDDVAYDIKQTIDGGYIVAGYSYSNDSDVSGNHGFNDYWIIKLDALGNIIWQKCLGGSIYDEAYSISQTQDGGYIVAGISASNNGDVSGNHGNFDYWIIKLDTLGSIIWQKCLGGGANDKAFSINQTQDGGYIVAGHSLSNDGDVSGRHGVEDYWIVKLDVLGSITWQKCLGGSNIDYGKSITQTQDLGYIIAGFSDSNNDDVIGNHGGSDFWIVKLNNVGNTLWQRS